MQPYDPNEWDLSRNRRRKPGFFETNMGGLVAAMLIATIFSLAYGAVSYAIFGGTFLIGSFADYFRGAGTALAVLCTMHTIKSN